MFIRHSGLLFAAKKVFSNSAWVGNYLQTVVGGC